MKVLYVNIIIVTISLTLLSSQAQEGTFQNIPFAICNFADLSRPIKFGFGKTQEGREFFWIIARSHTHPYHNFFSADYIGKDFGNGIISEYFADDPTRKIAVVDSDEESSANEIMTFLQKTMGWTMHY